MPRFCIHSRSILNCLSGPSEIEAPDDVAAVEWARGLLGVAWNVEVWRGGILLASLGREESNANAAPARDEGAYPDGRPQEGLR